MAAKSISVIIPVRNQGEKIGNCLRAVFSQTHLPQEVFVVDGHSTDNTVDKANKFPVTVLYEDYHTRSGACQVGLEHASGEYIAFTDADCIPDPEWLANLVNEFKDNFIGVGGTIKNISNNFWVHSINLAYGTFLGSANSIQGRTYNYKHFVKSISGCNSIYRKQDLLKVGGFNIKLPGAEDADINSRLLKSGRLLYVPSAIVNHDHGRKLKDFSNQMLRYGRDRSVAKKFNLQALPPLFLPIPFLALIWNPWVFIGFLAVYILMLLTLGSAFSVQQKSLKYLGSIPIVYVIEHSFYSFGFWRGLILRR